MCDRSRLSWLCSNSSARSSWRARGGATSRKSTTDDMTAPTIAGSPVISRGATVLRRGSVLRTTSTEEGRAASRRCVASVIGAVRGARARYRLWDTDRYGRGPSTAPSGAVVRDRFAARGSVVHRGANSTARRCSRRATTAGLDHTRSPTVSVARSLPVRLHQARGRAARPRDRPSHNAIHPRTAPPSSMPAVSGTPALRIGVCHTSPAAGVWMPEPRLWRHQWPATPASPKPN